MLFICMVYISSCNDKKPIEIDLKSAPTSAEVFGKNVISTEMYERDIAITPDGNEIIYTLGDYKQSKRCLVRIREVNGEWQSPEILNLSGTYQDIEPFYAEGGNKLFFTSNRPINNDSLRTDYNIWVSEREDQQWSEPIPLPENINSAGQEFFPSLSKNGNLYFTATRKDGIGSEDIFMSEFVNGIYENPTVLDSAINTSTYEFNAYINPDENLLIFSSYGRPDDMGGGDLYYSTKDEKGKWQPSKNMGNKINSTKLDYCPFVDLTNNTFYFTSERMKENKATFKNVKDLKSHANKPQNGMGDIYSTDFGSLNIN